MKLKKDLNLLDILCITTGAMLSSGIFLLPGLAFSKAGPAVFLSYFIAGILAAAGMLSQAELTSAMPKSGGTYYFVTRSMGAAVGTVYGLITMLSLALKSAFELISMAAFTSFIIQMDIRIIGLILCVVFILINILGAKGAGRIQTVLVFIIVPVLILYSMAGLPSVDVQNFVPFAPNGVLSIFSTAGFVFVSYGGLLKVASIAEEVRDPGRVLPLGMILSLIIIMLLYMGVIFVTTGNLQGDVLAKSLRPVTDGASVFAGRWGGILVTFVAILGFSSAANAGILGASRYPLALSRDDLLPKPLGKINNRFKSPHNAIILTGIMIAVSLFMKMDILIKAASSVLILTYIFSCLANIIMRESRLQNYKPQFKAPLYPWVQLFGICGFIFLLIEIGREALLISGLMIVFGFLLYWIFGRIKAQREFALLHLIERITAKELTSHSLETELKEVIRERDDIVRDRFDHLIENSIVIDIDEKLSFSEFFRAGVKPLSERMGVDEDTLFNLLMERENESSTALGPGFAIPHIVIEGEKKFDILIARSREGVRFSDLAPKVTAVFFLIGTKDERNFHLRALSAIAQIIQGPDFERKWMSAKNSEVLRDIVLLGERIRHLPI
jgi:amino acid transporter/mannitol/fructose-specific phosphotransferase system IIA component (Ntr-type)